MTDQDNPPMAELFNCSWNYILYMADIFKGITL